MQIAFNLSPLACKILHEHIGKISYKEIAEKSDNHEEYQEASRNIQAVQNELRMRAAYTQPVDK